jgi:hypothetical protein
MAVNGARGPGRIESRADDPSLTPFAGLAISGELARGLRLVGLTDAELAAVGRVAPVKQRRRGLSPGELTVAIAEAQLACAECFDDLVRHEALPVRVGCKTPPPGCRGSPVKLRAARPWSCGEGRQAALTTTRRAGTIGPCGRG